MDGRARAVLDRLAARGWTAPSGDRVDIGALLDASLAGSRLFTPDQVARLRAVAPTGPCPRVDVVDGSTQRVARELAADGPVALLNFASARNPGGGFLNGARAQEEDLCRCSGLYPTLVAHRAYYAANRAETSVLYTDHAIWSPDVPWFAVSGDGPLLDAPFLASVITMPAPNSAPFLQRNQGAHGVLEEAFLRRWHSVLAIARDQGVRTLLLGAWGCGAFGGDPEQAARTARSALESYGGSFDRVVFAIPDSPDGQQRAHGMLLAPTGDIRGPDVGRQGESQGRSFGRAGPERAGGNRSHGRVSARNLAVFRRVLAGS